MRAENAGLNCTVRQVTAEMGSEDAGPGPASFKPTFVVVRSVSEISRPFSALARVTPPAAVSFTLSDDGVRIVILYGNLAAKRIIQ